MKKIYCLGLFFAAVLSSSSALAEDNINVVKDSPVKIKNLPGEIGKYFVVKMTPTEKKNHYRSDTVSLLHEKYFGELEQLNDPETPQRAIKTDPDYYRLFVPATYYKSSIKQLSTVEISDLLADKSVDKAKEIFPIDDNSYTTKNRVNKVVDRL